MLKKKWGWMGMIEIALLKFKSCKIDVIVKILKKNRTYIVESVYLKSWIDLQKMQEKIDMFGGTDLFCHSYVWECKVVF